MSEVNKLLDEISEEDFDFDFDVKSGVIVLSLIAAKVLQYLNMMHPTIFPVDTHVRITKYIGSSYIFAYYGAREIELKFFTYTSGTPDVDFTDEKVKHALGLKSMDKIQDILEEYSEWFAEVPTGTMMLKL